MKTRALSVTGHVSSQRAVRCAPWGAGVVVVALLAGCDREKPETREIRGQAVQVRMTGEGGQAYMKAPETYKEVIKTMEPLAGNKDGGEPALLLVAQSKLGLAEPAAASALDASREAYTRSESLRAALTYWTSRNGIAKVAEAFDVKGDVDRVRAAKAENEKKIAEITAQKKEIETRVASIRAQAKEKLDAANSQLAEFARRLDQASRLSNTQAAPLIEQAHAVKTGAEKLRKDGQLLEAQADEIAPQITEKQLLIEQHTNLVKGLGDSEAGLLAREKASKKAAEEARTDAVRSGGEIDKLAGELAQFKNERLDAAYQSAGKLLSDAASAAQKASGSADQAKILIGSAKQNLSDLRLSHSRSVGGLGSVMEALASATPALPKSADYRAQAEALTKNAEELLNSAKEAMEGAKSAFQGVPLKGADREKLNHLIELLEGKSEAPPAPAEAKPAEGAAPAGTDPLLVAALTTFLEQAKAGKINEIIDQAYFASPDDKQFILDAMAIAKDMEALNAACRAKFNADLSAAMGPMAGKAFGSDPGSQLAQMYASASAEGAAYDISGETAKVTVTGGPQPVPFRKADNAWRLDFAATTGVDPAMMAMAKQMISGLSAAVRSLTDEVNAGKYSSIQEVLMALQQKMMPGGGAGLPTPPKSGGGGGKGGGGGGGGG